MKTWKTITPIAALCLLFATIACNNPDNNKGQPSTLPPTNGEETRYNLNEADTMALPVDTNRTDTTDSTRSPRP